MRHRIRNSRSILMLTSALALACGDDSGQEGTEGDSSSGTTGSPSTNTMTMTSPSGPSTSDSTTIDPDTTTSSSSTDPTDPTDPTTDTESDTASTESTGEPDMVLSIDRLSRYAPEPLADIFDEGAAEISAYDDVSQSLLVTNGLTRAIDVLDISDPTMPTLVQSITIADPELAEPTSVSVYDGVIAASAPNFIDTDPGAVLFFDIDGTELASVTVGMLPDMITFTPDGQTVLTANEGEPTGYGPGELDPEGSVSVIDVSAGPANVVQADVSTAGFGGLTDGDLDATTRIFGPGSTIAHDLEPEFVAVAPDSATAWVSLQENNALAIVDIATASVTDVVGAGQVDHSVTGLDASDDDGMINIATWPVFGMRQPDALAAFEVGGATYVLSANEGDSRDYDGLDEETRISNLTLDAAVFPNAADLQMDTTSAAYR